MKTVNATIIVKVKSAKFENEEVAKQPAGFSKRYRAAELRAEDNGELAEQARNFALKTIRLENKQPSDEGELVYVAVEKIEGIEECEPTCFTCIHGLVGPNEEPCKTCNEFHNNWE